LLCISEARPPERNRLRRRRNRSLAGECPETKRFRSRRSPCKDCKVEGRRPRPFLLYAGANVGTHLTLMGLYRSAHLTTRRRPARVYGPRR
jgi:hypothetical protein